MAQKFNSRRSRWTTTNYGSIATVLAAFLLLSISGVNAKGVTKRTCCQEVGICCQGKNNTCYVEFDLNGHHVATNINGKNYANVNYKKLKQAASLKKKFLNSIAGYQANHNLRCYCDESCSDMGDCCPDYKTFCIPRDCLVGPWSGWGPCSARCGKGYQKRTRPVLVSPMNGGQKCGQLQQSGSCYGDRCKHARHSLGFELRETAKIIPAKFGPWRKHYLYSPWHDIRRNLFFHHHANTIIKRPTYRAYFSITRSHGSCITRNKFWARNLKRGRTVCIECQPFAMQKRLGVRCKGHGVYKRETEWYALNVPGCRGKWIMQTRHEDGRCARDHSFIFV